MKSIEVKCLKCKKTYLANEFNTRFAGTYLSSECSKCGEVYEGKLLTLLIKQHYEEGQNESNRFECCMDMIELGQAMDKYLNPEPLKGQAK